MQATISSCLCYSRTLGYWSSHGDQLAAWMKADATLKLWGATYSWDGVSTSSKTQACNYPAKPDVLRVMCVAGQSDCR